MRKAVNAYERVKKKGLCFSIKKLIGHRVPLSRWRCWVASGPRWNQCDWSEGKYADCAAKNTQTNPDVEGKKQLFKTGSEEEEVGGSSKMIIQHKWDFLSEKTQIKETVLRVFHSFALTGCGGVGLLTVQGREHRSSSAQTGLLIFS